MNRRLMLVIIVMLLISVGLYFYPRFFSQQTGIKPEVTVKSSKQNNPFGTVKIEGQDKTKETEGAGDTEKPALPVKTYRDSFRNPFNDYRTEESGEQVRQTAAPVKTKEKNAVDELIKSAQKLVQPEKKTDTEIQQREVVEVPPPEKKTEAITPEKAREEAGFELIGIIGNDLDRRAIVSKNSGPVLIIKKGDELNGYQVSRITDEGVVFKYQEGEFILEMGGSHD